MDLENIRQAVIKRLHTYTYNVAYYRRIYVWSHFEETWAKDQWSSSSDQAEAVKDILLHVLHTEPDMIEKTEYHAREKAYQDFAEDYAPLD